MLKITNNLSINGVGDFISVDVPHSLDTVIEGNTAINHQGRNINATVYVDQDHLNVFIQSLQPHLGALSVVQLSEVRAIIRELQDPSVADKTGALEKIRKFGLDLGTGVLASLIAGFMQ